MANVEPLLDGWRPTQTWLGQLGSEQPPADTSTKANRSHVMFDESIRTRRGFGNANELNPFIPADVSVVFDGQGKL